jgi:hypothetical protein
MDRKMTIAIPAALLTVGLISAIGLAVSQNKARAVAEDALTAVSGQTEELSQMVEKYKQEVAELRLAATRVAPVEITDANPDLVAQLQAKNEEIAALRAQLEEGGGLTDEQRQAQRVAEFETRRQEQQQRAEQWRQENPEEYARQQEERENRIREMRERATSRIEFLASVNTENLTPEYRENHEQLVQKLRTMNRAVSAISQDPESEASRELARQMREQSRDVGEMMEKEKEILLGDLASTLGYEGDGTQEFIEYVRYIDEVTSLGGLMRGGFGGRGGGGRGGPGGGGR